MVTIASTARRRAAPCTEGAVQVAVARTDVGSESVRASVAALSDGDRERARRFAFDRERRRFIVARALLRRLLAARLDIPPESVELAYGKRGKPALAGRFAASDLRFNLSHSEDVAVYAFASGSELGIDVEAVRAIPDADDLAVRCFSRREQARYQALDPRDRALGFFQCWTRKEAFIKALGDGLFHPLDRFDVSLAPGEPAKLLRVDGVPGEDCAWTLHDFMPGPGLTGAIVVQRVRDDSLDEVRITHRRALAGSVASQSGDSSTTTPEATSS